MVRAEIDLKRSETNLLCGGGEMEKRELRGKRGSSEKPKLGCDLPLALRVASYIVTF